MQIELINDQHHIKLDLDGLKDACTYIAGKFDPDDSRSLNIIFVSEPKIRNLNKKYRNIDRATDVLSFSYLDDPITDKDQGRPEARSPEAA